MSRSSFLSRSPTSSPPRASVRSPNGNLKTSPSMKDNTVEDVIDENLEKIKNALLRDALLKPTYVEVKDESSWYAWRSEIGPRKQMAKLTKLNEKQGKWESRIFMRKFNVETGEYNIERSLVGKEVLYEERAYRQCIEHANTRDNSMRGLSLNRAKEWQNKKAYRILVVSDLFGRHKATDRLRIVHRCLLRQLLMKKKIPDDHTKASEYAKTLDMKGFSGAVGENVLQLPMFHMIPDLDFSKLVIEAKTPGQWKSERYHSPPDEHAEQMYEIYGLSLMESISMGIPPSLIKITSQTNTIPQSSMTNAAGMGGKSFPLSKVDKEREDYKHRTQTNKYLRFLLEEKPTQEQLDESRGIYGHFYHEGDAISRRFMIQEYNRNKKMLASVFEAHDPELAAVSQKERAAKGKKDFAAAFQNDLTVEGMDTAAAKVNNVLTNMMLNNAKIKECAKRMQRIYRKSIYRHAIIKDFREERHILVIQRQIRKAYACTFVKLWRIIIQVATTKVQSVYRGMKARRYTDELKRQYRFAVTCFSRFYRGRLARRYVKWIIKHQKAAIAIQKLGRGFLSRCFVRDLRALPVHEKVFIPATILIQRHIRGVIGRKRVKEHTYRVLHNVVIVPCAICIQRIIRGFLARREVARLFKIHFATCRIQALARGAEVRRAVRKIRRRIYIYHCAVSIQKIIRGYMDRQRAHRRRIKHHKETVIIPAAMLIQANVRGLIQRSKLWRRKLEWFSAFKIQNQYRCLLQKREIRKRWKQLVFERDTRMAIRIQTFYRAYKGRRIGREKLLDIEGQRLYAARIIMRSFTQFFQGRKFVALRDRHRIEEAMELIDLCREERKFMDDDMEDIDMDLEQLRRYNKRYGLRLEELRMFKSEANLRLPQIEGELDELEGAEIEQGWGEALEQEWEALTNKMNMANEEMRAFKILVRECEDDIVKLKMERVDIEMEYERFQMREVAEYEHLGRLELGRNYVTQANSWRKRIYHQKCRWKDGTIRKKIIVQNLDILPSMQEQVRARRTYEQMSSLRSEAHIERETEEEWLLKHLIKKDRRRRAKEDQKKGYKNEHLNDAFDSVVKSTMDVIKASTYNMRRPYPDLREDHKALCWECGKVFCHCPGSKCYHAVKRYDEDSDDEH